MEFDERIKRNFEIRITGCSSLDKLMKLGYAIHKLDLNKEQSGYLKKIFRKKQKELEGNIGH